MANYFLLSQLFGESSKKPPGRKVSTARVSSMYIFKLCLETDQEFLVTPASAKFAVKKNENERH
jgi:hypothetical protein